MVRLRTDPIVMSNKYIHLSIFHTCFIQFRVTGGLELTQLLLGERSVTSWTGHQSIREMQKKQRCFIHEINLLLKYHPLKIVPVSCKKKEKTTCVHCFGEGVAEMWSGSFIHIFCATYQTFQVSFQSISISLHP